jgi:hypothetical protein
VSDYDDIKKRIDEIVNGRMFLAEPSEEERQLTALMEAFIAAPSLERAKEIIELDVKLHGFVSTMRVLAFAEAFGPGSPAYAAVRELAIAGGWKPVPLA